jgi:isopenicillin N synthase-like dioxygenase
MAACAAIALAMLTSLRTDVAYFFADDRAACALAWAVGLPALLDLGVPREPIDRALAASQAFFALPEAVKRRYVTGVGGQRGYTPFGVETAKDSQHFDLKEFWHMGRELPAGHAYAPVMPPNVWPEEVADFREEITWLFNALEDFGLRVLQALAAYLGLERRWFDDPVRDGNSVLRLLHYPPVPPDGPNIRAGAHGDINVITLLLGAEEAGLQLLSRDGEWLEVPAPEGSLVINVGDMLQRQTGGRLPSTTHRVVNPAPERRHLPRYSMPFFLHYRPDWLITPFEGDMAPITANDFLLQRLAEIKLA